MADEEPRTGELKTINYGWTKPTVGASDDAWGDYLNTDLDGIDSTVKSVSTVASAAQTSGQVDAKIAAAAYVLPTASTTVLGGVKVDGDNNPRRRRRDAFRHAVERAAGHYPRHAAAGTAGGRAVVGFGRGSALHLFYNDGNSSQWVIAVNAAASLLPASTTVLGGVKVDGTTIKAAADGTISAPIFMGDNRIINGDMRIDQRNNGASGMTINIYTVDRWKYLATQAAKFNWQRQAQLRLRFLIPFLPHLSRPTRL